VVSTKQLGYDLKFVVPTNKEPGYETVSNQDIADRNREIADRNREIALK